MRENRSSSISSMPDDAIRERMLGKKRKITEVGEVATNQSLKDLDGQS